MSIITEEPVLIEGTVWCDHEGDVHQDTDDPFGYGPQYPKDVEGDENYTVRTDPDYNGELALYRCPGPHRPVFYLDSLTDIQERVQNRLVKEHSVNPRNKECDNCDAVISYPRSLCPECEVELS